MKRSPMPKRTSSLRRTPFRTKRKASRFTKDGRLILGQQDYRFLRLETWINQGYACGQCHGALDTLAEMELHHIKSRGMSGSKRDDREVIGLCHFCHIKVTPQPQWSKKESA